MRRHARAKTPKNLTPELREHLILSDFLGQLTRQERKLAQKHGLLCWDLYIKAKRLDQQTGGAPSRQCDFVGGDRLAPSFEPDGSIRYPEYKYLIKTYADLQKFKDRHNL